MSRQLKSSGQKRASRPASRSGGTGAAGSRQSVPDRRAAILEAATVEFGAHGFAATGVDRIAARARVNKALIYYYFGSKLSLYRHLLAHLMEALASRLAEVAKSDNDATIKLERWIETLGTFLAEHKVVPPIMLRELADGGSRLDPPTLRRMVSILPMLASIVQQGKKEDAFVDVDPIALHFMILGSLMLVTANEPIRRRVREMGLAQPPLELAPYMRSLQRVALQSLRKDVSDADHRQ
jgi:AcrR family transcriptional regulator